MSKNKPIQLGLCCLNTILRNQRFPVFASRKMIEDAKNEASSLINQAGSRGDQIVEEAKTQAIEEQLKIKSATEADIEQNVTKAKENLKQEVSSLVLAGAAKILEKEVDAESNKQIIDDLIKEL